MTQTTSLEKFRIPLGNQEVELQQIDHAEGGMNLLRIRIREGRRFTIFDIDPLTARRWGDAMRNWSDAQQPSRSGEGGS
jgi:Family of unknown function (DUF6967)